MNMCITIKLNLLDEDLEKLNSAVEVLQYLINELDTGDSFEDEDEIQIFDYWDLSSAIDTIESVIEVGGDR